MDQPANPYAAPRAQVADHPSLKPGRPVSVWMLSILLGVLGALTLVTYVLLEIRPEIFPAAERARIAAAGATVHVAGLGGGLLLIWTAVALFRLKRAAMRPYVAHLAIVAGQFAYVASTQPRANFAAGIGNLAAHGAILAFIWHLSRRGVLR